METAGFIGDEFFKRQMSFVKHVQINCLRLKITCSCTAVLVIYFYAYTVAASGDIRDALYVFAFMGSTNISP
jgi:uncharacterized membrane protein YqhA